MRKVCARKWSAWRQLELRLRCGKSLQRASAACLGMRCSVRETSLWPSQSLHQRESRIDVHGSRASLPLAGRHVQSTFPLNCAFRDFGGSGLHFCMSHKCWRQKDVLQQYHARHMPFLSKPAEVRSRFSQSLLSTGLPALTFQHKMLNPGSTSEGCQLLCTSNFKTLLPQPCKSLQRFMTGKL